MDVGYFLAVSLLLLPSLFAERPNIIFIVADDLGWYDIGFRNPDMITPNIDKLAKEGIIFESAYVQPFCSPVIAPGQPVCVPLNYTFLPQELKKLGYATHMIRKWHLGFCKWECTPTYRGIDSYFGYYSAQEDYFNHSQGHFLDFRDGKLPAWNYSGEYSAVPQKYKDMYPHVVNPGRKTYSGMVSALDDAVGNVTRALKKRGLFNNTLILFTTDNGGPITSYSCNWPLRGGKHSIWQGGARGVSFMNGTGLKKTGTTYNGVGDYKLLLGYPDGPDGWHKPQNNTKRTSYPQRVYEQGDKSAFLFNIREDNNLAQQMPDMVEKLTARIDEYRKQMVPANFPKVDPASNPRNFGNAWTPGWC